MGAESETGRAAPRPPAKTLLLALGAGVLALAGSFVFLERNRLFPATKVELPRTGSGTPLQLTLEAQGNGLNIRWNPQSEPVAHAREGRLVIKERDQRVQTLLFDPQQLKTGYVYYESSAERLEFQMEVVDTAGVIAKASVMALPSRTPAAPVVESPLAAALERNPSVKPPPAPKTPEAPQSSRPAARLFLPPPTSKPSGDPSSVIALEPPANPPSAFASPEASLPSATSSLAGLAVQPRDLPIPARQPIKVGGNLQAGNLVKSVTPVYPPLAKAAHIQGVVRFTALIAKDGTVRNLQLVSGHPLLVQAATAAVRQWVYRPTLLNGEPMEVITQIEVNFTR
jgi:protein TonB